MAKPRKTGRSRPTAKPVARAKKATKAKAPDHATHAPRFERAAYDLPVMDLAEAIALATALLAVTPAKPAPVVREEAKRVAAARDRAKTVQKGRARETTSVDARAHDVAMDRAWGTFVRRVQDHVELPPSRRPEASDIARVYLIISDLSILKLNYLAEFAQIGARLDALKREGLLDVAGSLAGKPFLDEVLHCHGEYGQALGLMPASSPVAGEVADRGEARLALIEAIAEYAVQVMAQARAGRPESWAPVQKALKPIMDLRVRQERYHRAPPAPPAPAPHPPIRKLEHGVAGGSP